MGLTSVRTDDGRKPKGVYILLLKERKVLADTGVVMIVINVHLSIGQDDTVLNCTRLDDEAHARRFLLF